MKNFNKILILAMAFLLLAAGCQKVQLKQEAPSSPQASYGQLPK